MPCEVIEIVFFFLIGSSSKKHKHRSDDSSKPTFANLFGTPITKVSKVSPDPKNSKLSPPNITSNSNAGGGKSSSSKSSEKLSSSSTKDKSNEKSEKSSSSLKHNKHNSPFKDNKQESRKNEEKQRGSSDSKKEKSHSKERDRSREQQSVKVSTKVASSPKMNRSPKRIASPLVNSRLPSISGSSSSLNNVGTTDSKITSKNEQNNSPINHLAANTSRGNKKKKDKKEKGHDKDRDRDKRNTEKDNKKESHNSNKFSLDKFELKTSSNSKDSLISNSSVKSSNQSLNVSSLLPPVTSSSSITTDVVDKNQNSSLNKSEKGEDRKHKHKKKDKVKKDEHKSEKQAKKSDSTPKSTSKTTPNLTAQTNTTSTKDGELNTSKTKVHSQQSPVPTSKPNPVSKKSIDSHINDKSSDSELEENIPATQPNNHHTSSHSIDKHDAVVENCNINTNINNSLPSHHQSPQIIPPTPLTPSKTSKKVKEKPLKSAATNEPANKRKRKPNANSLMEPPPSKTNKRGSGGAATVLPTTNDLTPSAISTTPNSMSMTNMIESTGLIGAGGGAGSTPTITNTLDNHNHNQIELNNVNLTNDYMSELKELQHKIMTLQDNNELQQVVEMIAATGRFEITSRTFDFDLCALDRNTVQRLQEFFAS